MVAANSKKKTGHSYPAPWGDGNSNRIGSGKVNPMAREYLNRMNPKED